MGFMMQIRPEVLKRVPCAEAGSECHQLDWVGDEDCHPAELAYVVMKSSFLAEIFYDILPMLLSGNLFSKGA